jgi:Fe-S cluster assembly ATP-binding protein
MTNFLKESVNAVREARGQEELSSADFLQYMREKASLVDIDADLTKRSVNEGFSGGEKKRNEIFQLAMLEPKLAILDETDSGLDIDALKSVADGVNKLRNDERGFLVITHYERILQYITPDRVHVMLDGRVVRSGDKGLATTLEEKGYDWIREEEMAAA